MKTNKNDIIALRDVFVSFRMEEIGMNKIEELIEQLKIYTGLVEKKPEKKQCNACAIVVTILAVIGAMVAIGFALYKFFGPAYFEEFDDFEDDFDDDFFEDDEEDAIEVPVEKKEEEDAE